MRWKKQTNRLHLPPEVTLSILYLSPGLQVYLVTLLNKSGSNYVTGIYWDQRQERKCKQRCEVVICGSQGKGVGMISYANVERIWLWLCNVPGVVVPWQLISISAFHHLAYSWILKYICIWLIFSRTTGGEQTMWWGPVVLMMHCVSLCTFVSSFISCKRAKFNRRKMITIDKNLGQLYNKIPNSTDIL